MGQGKENQKGEVNIQTQSSSKPAFIPGHPYTSESKTKQFLYSFVGYIIAFSVTTALIVLAVFVP